MTVAEKIIEPRILELYYYIFYRFWEINKIYNTFLTVTMIADRFLNDTELFFLQ